MIKPDCLLTTKTQSAQSTTKPELGALGALCGEENKMLVKADWFSSNEAFLKTRSVRKSVVSFGSATKLVELNLRFLELPLSKTKAEL